jgi:hypothetical protein
LALSSLHIAYLRPAESERYLRFAAHHQSLALPLIRSALTCVNKDNCHALYACSHIITKYAFASTQEVKSRVFSSGIETVLDFVPLLRGVYSVYDYALKWLSAGPLSFCQGHWHKRSHDRASEFSQNPDDAHFARLLLLFNTSSNKDAHTYCEALNSLRGLSARAATLNRSISAQTLVLSWPAQVPRRYFILISERKPEALVVMAYYCVFLKGIESFWYMKGCAARLLDRCQNDLSDQWLPLIDWPLSIVGLPEDK